MDYLRIQGIPTPLSRVVLGTDWFNARRFYWITGRPLASPFVDRRRRQEVYALLDGVLEAGCTAFDTARTYRDSEELLGAWIRARGVRERVVLVTKGAHPGPGWTSRLSAAEISRDLERSLRALRTDYIDLYLLHYDDGVSDVGPMVEVLGRHLAAGRIRALGLSNWTTSRIARATAYAKARQLAPPVASSVQFSLAVWRESPWPGAVTLSGEAAEADRRWYQANGMTVLAYSSLAMGFFSPSRPYAEGGVPGAPARLGDRVFLDEPNLARLKRAREMAARRGLAPGQVALAWVLGFDPRVLAIVGARTVASYVDAAAACDVTLTESERAWLVNGDGGGRGDGGEGTEERETEENGDSGVS